MGNINSPIDIYRKFRWNTFWNNFQLPVIPLGELIENTERVEPVIFDNLCLPPYNGPKDHDDIAPLLSLVKHFHPRTVLEIGTAHGATAANICAVSDARVYTVNALPEQLDGNYITFSLTRDEIGCVYRKYGYEGRIEQIYENTWGMDITKYTGINRIDFVIIDGCHDTEFVLNDFLGILPVISPDAIVLFHDIGLSKTDPLTLHLDDGYIACMYLRKLGYNIQLLQGTWWGIWQAGISRTELKLDAKIKVAIEKMLIIKQRSIFDEARLLRLYLEKFR